MLQGPIAKENHRRNEHGLDGAGGDVDARSLRDPERRTRWAGAGQQRTFGMSADPGAAMVALQHERLRAEILARIDSGEWAAGTRILSEREMCERALSAYRSQGSSTRHANAWSTTPISASCRPRR